jgi:hypothetical protein
MRTTTTATRRPDGASPGSQETAPDHARATAPLVDGVAGARWFAALPGWSASVVHGDRTTAWGPAFAGTTGATRA